jgi:23S rRNA pseudouridine955/2504/2580 synthase
MKEINIDRRYEGQRLINFLGKLLPGTGSGFLFKMLRKKNITLNGKKASGNENLKSGDLIRVYFSDETYDKFHASGSNMEVRHSSENNGSMIRDKTIELRDDIILPDSYIVYQDQDIIIMNKPAGLLSQKARPTDISLVDMLNAYYPDFKAGLANRLDRNTSGIVTAGLTIRGAQYLNSIFKEHTVEKYYQTLVFGNLKSEKVLDAYIIKDHKHNKVMVTRSPGERTERIKTSFIPIKHYKYKGRDLTLLSVRLYTGRSHQIRVSLEYLGFPAAGDHKYCDADRSAFAKNELGLKYQFLHAYKLVMPGYERAADLYEKYAGKVFTAPLPEKLSEVIDRIS